jgi:hypothetical protein
MPNAKTIAFVSQGLNLQGTTVALYDYAVGAEAILGYRPIILINETGNHDLRVMDAFQRRFAVFGFGDISGVDRIAEREKADLAYFIKAGTPDGWVTRTIPSAVHAVFATWPRDAHGDSYAYISEWLATRCTGGRAPYVPHIVHVDDARGDLRTELGIPRDALTLGCHGGIDSFDVPCARLALEAALERRSDLWFVGLNLRPFLHHDRAKFLPGTHDRARKRAFIETCDAMLHARHRGETFGLAVAEFSICNRPVLTYGGVRERAHIHMLGDAALVYRNERELADMLLNLDRSEIAMRNWDRYSRNYGFAPVMRKFADVFIENPVDLLKIRQAWPQPESWMPSDLIRYARGIHRAIRGKAPW